MSAKLTYSEDMRMMYVIKSFSMRGAAKWYINAARIYRDSAISHAENYNRYWANLYIDAAEECFERGKQLRNGFIPMSTEGVKDENSEFVSNT